MRAPPSKASRGATIDGSEIRIALHDPENEEGLGVEGSIKSMPRLARSRPSDRAARRKALEGRLRVAQEKAAAESALPLVHGRCCLLGLTVLELIRAAAWWQGTIPGYSVFGMHFLTTTSDIACLLCAMPLFVTGTQGQCVQLGCLGPMLTLVFAMSLVDISALGAYLVVATPRPLAPGARSYVDALEACVGVWEFALVASVALQMALCASSWRVYRELRMTGLYPPGSDPAGVGKIREISVMEVMCEAEDVELLADCEVNCDTGLKSPLLAYPAAAASSSTSPDAKATPSLGSSSVPHAEAFKDSDVIVDCKREHNQTGKCHMRPPVNAAVGASSRQVSSITGRGRAGVSDEESYQMGAAVVEPTRSREVHSFAGVNEVCQEEVLIEQQRQAATMVLPSSPTEAARTEAPGLASMTAVQEDALHSGKCAMPCLQAAALPGITVTSPVTARELHGISEAEAKGTQGWRELCERGGESLQPCTLETREALATSSRPNTSRSEGGAQERSKVQEIMLVERRSVSRPETSSPASKPPREKVREASCDARIEGVGGAPRSPEQRGTMPTVWSPGDYKADATAEEDSKAPPFLPREKTF